MAVAVPKAPPVQGLANTLRSIDGLAWLFLLLGLSLVHRYRFLFDDAFIYFRYVDNFLHLDLGFVYNAGEYVEGYSSPAQLLVLTALRALGLSFPTAVWLLGYASFVLFWALCVRLNRHWSPPGPQLHLPLALLSANYGLTTFFTSGLETPLVHITAAGYALAIANPRSRLARALVYLSPLVRPELALALALFLLYRAVWGGEPLLRRLRWPAITNGSWLAFRVLYYAELAPNTFYLKDDVEPLIGLRYLWDLERAYHVAPLLALGALVTILLRRRAPVHLPERGLLLCIAVAVAGYIVKVGGAPMHYWYLAFAFTLAVTALSGLAEHGLAAWGSARVRTFCRPLMCIVWVGACALLPAQLTGHPALGTPVHAEADLILDAAFHRDSPRYQPEALPALARASLARARRAGVGTGPYPAWVTENWCRAAYLSLDKGVVHSLGLTDKVLAHVDAPDLRQGHKAALVPMARQLAAIRRTGTVTTGLHARAVATGEAPRWVAENLPAIERIEAQVFNQHRPLPNLRLALSPRTTISPPPEFVYLLRP